MENRKMELLNLTNLSLKIVYYSMTLSNHDLRLNRFVSHFIPGNRVIFVIHLLLILVIYMKTSYVMSE
jgi:hypothetical protein